MTLYTMARVDCDEETPPKTAEWKEACSSALMANVCYFSKFIPVTELLIHANKMINNTLISFCS